MNRCATSRARRSQSGKHEQREDERSSIQIEVGARGLTPERVANYITIASRVGARLIRFVIDDANYHPTADTVIAFSAKLRRRSAA